MRVRAKIRTLALALITLTLTLSRTSISQGPLGGSFCTAATVMSSEETFNLAARASL